MANNRVAFVDLETFEVLDFLSLLALSPGRLIPLSDFALPPSDEEVFVPSFLVSDSVFSALASYALLDFESIEPSSFTALAFDAFGIFALLAFELFALPDFVPIDMSGAVVVAASPSSVESVVVVAGGASVVAATVVVDGASVASVVVVFIVVVVVAIVVVVSVATVVVLVEDSVGEAVGESVGDSVGESVEAAGQKSLEGDTVSSRTSQPILYPLCNGIASQPLVNPIVTRL